MSVIMQNQFKSQGNQLIPSHQAELVLVYQRMIEAPNAQQKMSEQCRTPVCSAEALFFFFFYNSAVSCTLKEYVLSWSQLT